MSYKKDYQREHDVDDFELMRKGGFSISDSDDEDPINSSESVSVVNTKITQPKLLFNQIKYSHSSREAELGNIIFALEKQVGVLQKENAKLTTEHDREINRLASENQRATIKLKDDALRNTTMAKVQSSREFFNVLSDVINGLTPEVEYARVRDYSEHKLKPEESLLVHVWELVEPLKKENKQLRVEIQNLREEVRTTNEKHQKILQELRHSNELLGSKDDDVKRNINNYETSIRIVEQQLNVAKLDVETLREKGAKYDELYRDFVKLEKEKIILENKVSFFAGSPVDTRKDVPLNENDLRVKYSILCTDKEYLVRENIRLTETVKKLEEKIEKREFEIDEHKRIAKDYMQTVLSSKSSNFNIHEKRIDDELSNLRDKHKEEVETAKNTLKEIYERQLGFIREIKEALELKNEQLETTVKERQKGYDELLMENRTLQRKLHQDFGELRIKLSIKEEELIRTQNLYEETLANLKSLRNENEMLKDKMNILKSEYYKLEGSLKEESAGVRAQLAVSKEQLANYEAIEREIDEAIIGLASKSSGFDGHADNIFLQTLQNAPSASKRRIQQALALAQKLNIKQNEVKELLKELAEYKSRVETLETELRIAKSLLEKSNQPYQYLVRNIEEKEKEALDYKIKLSKTDENSQNLREEHAKLIEDYANLQKDMNKIMIKRENIQHIQQIILSLLQENREGVSQNDLHRLVDEMNLIASNQGTVYNNLSSSRAFSNKNERESKLGHSQQQKMSSSHPLKSTPSKTVAKAQGSAPEWYTKLKQMKATKH